MTIPLRRVLGKKCLCGIRIVIFDDRPLIFNLEIAQGASGLGLAARSEIFYAKGSLMNLLEVKKLHVSVAEREIVSGLELSLPAGEVHALMGPNGTGKSTLAKVLAGDPSCVVTSGEVRLGGEDLFALPIEERARKGLFVAFQYPAELPGVSIANFIRAALLARMPDKTKFSATEYYKELYAAMDALKIERSFTSRGVNEGFSGGEKKRCEVLQMKMLRPTVAILDETDSGLDIDALKIVAEGVNSMRSAGRAMLVITHYERLLEYIEPDRVHVMAEGRIVKSGGKELARELEAKGYAWAKAERL